MVIMTKEGSTQIINFMSFGAVVLAIGCDQGKGTACVTIKRAILAQVLETKLI